MSSVVVPSLPSDKEDRESSEADESLDLHRIQALNSVCEDLALKMGLEVVDRSREAASQQTLSLFPKKKPKKTTEFKVPLEFLEQDKRLLERRSSANIVSNQSKQIFRLNQQDWAAISHQRVPDNLLISRSKVVEKFSKRKGKITTFQDKSHADRLAFHQDVGEAAAHSLRLASAGALASQFAISSVEKLILDPSLSPQVKEQLRSIQAASQLGLSAVAEVAETQSRLKSAVAFKERDLWLDHSSFSSEVVKEAKKLPLPLGSVDDQGLIVKPTYLGEKFNELLSTRYKSTKYANKVDPVFKRPAPVDSTKPAKKFKSSKTQPGKKSDSTFRSAFQSKNFSGNQPFRGRGRGRGSDKSSGRGRGKKPSSK